MGVIQLLTMGNTGLPTQLQLFDEIAVLRAIDVAQIVEEAPATADELQQPLTRAIVFSMCLKMTRELVDSFRNERDLDSGTPGVGRVLFMALNSGFCDFFS